MSVDMCSFDGDEEVTRFDVVAVVARGGEYVRRVGWCAEEQANPLTTALQYVVEGEHGVVSCASPGWPFSLGKLYHTIAE